MYYIGCNFVPWGLLGYDENISLSDLRIYSLGELMQVEEDG